MHHLRHDRILEIQTVPHFSIEVNALIHHLPLGGRQSLCLNCHGCLDGLHSKTSPNHFTPEIPHITPKKFNLFNTHRTVWLKIAARKWVEDEMKSWPLIAALSV